VANKSEGTSGEAGRLEAYALGLGEPIPISAEHDEGMSDLYDALRAVLPENAEASDIAPDTAHPVRVAIVGRPNAGKSTLINRLIGEERLLTGPEAGVTRDAIAVEYVWQNHKFRIYDTAGLRRRSVSRKSWKNFPLRTRSMRCALPRSWSCCSTLKMPSKSRTNALQT
jgi:GTP-binding protein